MLSKLCVSDGALFGVSLIASLQYTGQALPKPIQAAIKHLSEHALDRVGIFRKPGVKSRIQKLRQQIANLGMHTFKFNDLVIFDSNENLFLHKKLTF